MQDELKGAWKHVCLAMQHGLMMIVHTTWCMPTANCFNPGNVMKEAGSNAAKRGGKAQAPNVSSKGDGAQRKILRGPKQ